MGAMAGPSTVGEMISAIRTEVKALKSEIMDEFRATVQTMLEEIVKELCTTMTSIQSTVND